MKEELGRPWLEPDLFRIGASSLLADIERQLEHFVTGRYSAARPPRDGLRDRPWPTVKEILDDHGLRPGAGGRRAMSHAWLDEHKAGFGHFIDGALRRPRGQGDASRSPTRPTASCSARVAQGTAADVDARGQGGRARPSRPGRGSPATSARATSTPSPGMSRSASRFLAVLETHGQRQADPRDAATSTSRWSRATSTTTPAGPS